MVTTLSASAIRSLYLTKQCGEDSSNSNTASCKIGEVEDLTPSARFVVSEVRKRLTEFLTSTDNAQIIDEATIEHLILQVEHNEGESLSNRERDSVSAYIKASRLHYDVLTPLVENPDVNDIIVRAFNDVSVQMSGRRNVATDVAFADSHAYKSFIEHLLKRVGKSVSTAQPVIDAAIESDVRACVTHESFSPSGSGPMLTLRIARHKDITLDGLIQLELAPSIIMNYLATLISCGRCTALIGGEVGTGKTTLVRALAMKMPEDEAILVIEDTNEIVLNRKFVRTLLTREANTEGAGEISPARAIRTGMRMAMNRVILGEMRDGNAAEAFIDVCSSGHTGLSTIHARSARDAIGRLELFLSRVRTNFQSDAIRREIANAVGMVVFIGVDRYGKRRIMEVVEVGSAADGPPQLQPLFKFETQGHVPTWKREGGVSLFDNILRQEGVVLPLPKESISFDPDQLYRNVI